MILPRVTRAAALVAAALTAACLASPLTPAAATSASSARTSGPFVLSYKVPSVNAYYGLAPLERDRKAITGHGKSVEDAVASAATYTFPAPGTRGPVAGVGAAKGLCLAPIWGSAYLGGQPCDGGHNQTVTLVWHAERGGYVIAKDGAFYLAATASGVRWANTIGSASLLSPEALGSPAPEARP